MGPEGYRALQAQRRRVGTVSSTRRSPRRGARPRRDSSIARVTGGPLSEDPYWFDAVADFLGPAYLRNAFTKGTEREVDFLVDALGLEPGMRVLDVGCGPGRHSLALATRGIDVLGVDLSPEFIELARESVPAGTSFARFEVADVCDLAYAEEFDA